MGKKDYLNIFFILLILTVISVVLVKFNPELTGFTTKDNQITKISLSDPKNPNSFVDYSPTYDAGNWISVKIDTGIKGTNENLDIYEDSGTRKRRIDSIQISDCTSNICYSGKTYFENVFLKKNWNGIYCIGINDFATYEKVFKCFKVK